MNIRGVRLAITFCLVTLFTGLLTIPRQGSEMLTPVARAAGYIDFEDGTDVQPIRSTIPGLKFTTTNGQDWIYGDWRTGKYNGKYPNGAYSSNGNFFAWLGPNQGFGRIDFVDDAGATYISFGVSTSNYVVVSGYDANNKQIAQQRFDGGNLDTGRTNELRLEAPANQRLKYIIISGEANYWLIDDLTTDAAGVPDTRIPLVFLPGIAGSRLRNQQGEVWPNGGELLLDLDDDSLLVLRLGNDGATPLEPDNPDYNTVIVGDIIRSELGQDTYASMITYLNSRGYVESEGTLTVFPYDWRKDLSVATTGLDAVIAGVKARTGAEKVNLLAHSMGGLVARSYLADPKRAANVNTLVSLGTPYLGAPKAFVAINYGTCFVPIGSLCITHEPTIKALAENAPAVYQLLPTSRYFDTVSNGYFERDWDENGDGRNDGWLSYQDTSQLIKDHYNASLVTKAEQFHNPIDGYNRDLNGVRVYVFVGYSKPTITSVREYQRRKWYKPWEFEIAHDIREGNGDSTVPLHSADLGRNQPQGDISGDVSYFYAKLDHGELAKFNNGRTVLRLVADILEARGVPQAAAFTMTIPADTAAPHNAPTLLRSEVAGTLRQTDDFIPIDSEPAPISGRQILVNGAAEVIVTDTQGRTAYVNPDGNIEVTIPGASLNRIGRSTSIFLPNNGTYTIKLDGRSLDVVDMRLRTIDADRLTETVVYKDIPMTAAATAQLDFPTSTTPSYDLRLDGDGDGTFESILTPLARLDATASQDTVSPVSNIVLDGQKASQGWYEGEVTVTINSADEEDGSGVAFTEYSLDDGRTVQRYDGPFTVDASAVARIIARAVDFAGNEEVDFATTGVGPQRRYLPLLRR